MKTAPNSLAISRTAVAPIQTPRTLRRHGGGGITSLPAGKMVPIAAFALLREDGVRSGRFRFSFESMETADVLLNAQNVRVMAYLVPNLAFERFNGSMDQLNLSYQGKPPLEGEPVVPFIETHAAGAHGANAIYKHLGLHAQPTDQVNTAYLEAYNAIWNFRAKNRSPELLDLVGRTRLQTDLAPAFWAHERFAHIVPSVDFDAIDGEVALNVVNTKLNVRGIGFAAGEVPAGPASMTVKDAGTLPAGEAWAYPFDASATDPVVIKRKGAAGAASLPDIYAELAQDGITVSLSNIELARKTQAFAKLRQQFNMHDDWIIGLLMNGIQIPDQALKQPMLVGEKRTIFGHSKRYASDAGNLTESVVNGATFVDMVVSVPRIGTGGILMIVAEITPDQLYERQRDPYFHCTTVAELPAYLRDTLDPEKVDVVKNSRIDTSHSNPNGVFGYEPLNARWNIDQPRVGGKMYRPTVDGTADEMRQRIWSCETANPVLGPDFYLATNIHQDIFVVTNEDPYEVVIAGDLFIEGHTVFGSHLLEASDDYEKIMEIAPVDRIEQAE